MKRKEMLPLRLQLFANEEPGNEGNNENANNDGFENDTNENDENDRDEEKKFTQKDLNKLLAKEKRDGKKSVLKSLGFNTEEEAKSAFDLLKALTDSQKSEEEKLKEDKEKTNKALADEKRRADEAESKLSCLTNGVGKDYIDDVLAIAKNKVDDDNSLDDVIKSMKKDKKYSVFFGSSNSGTGNPPGHGKGGNDFGKNYGEEIAKRNTSKEIKKSFFD